MASSSHLKPGEKGSITVKVDTAGRNGKLVKNVIVTTNDPKRPTVTLLLRVNVK